MHTHYSSDCATPPERLVARCVEVGLSCIALTDHNTIKGALEVERMAPFKVIVAEEIKTPFGEITGLFLKEEVPPGLSPQETVARIKEQGGLVSIPHPFDRFRNSVLKYEALESILSQVDIIEVFNSRTTLLRDSEKARRFAQEHGFLCGAGSDAHTPMELGNVYVEMPNFNGPEEFKEALAKGKIIARRTNPLIHLTTAYTKIKKRLWLSQN